MGFQEEFLKVERKKPRSKTYRVLIDRKWKRLEMDLERQNSSEGSKREAEGWQWRKEKAMLSRRAWAPVSKEGRWGCSTKAEIIANFGKTGLMKLQIALYLNVTWCEKGCGPVSFCVVSRDVTAASLRNLSCIQSRQPSKTLPKLPKLAVAKFNFVLTSISISRKFI